MRRVVSLYVPTWPTDRWRRRSGAAPDQPVLMAVRDGPRRVIHALDANAAALGLHPGMAVSQAQAMLPGLEILDATPEDDSAALTRLAAWCLRLSPLTAPCPPDGVWLDMTGCAHLFGGEAAMLGLICARLHGAGIAARAAMADTPGCAHAAARYGKTAIVPQGQARAALFPLPIEALRLDKDTAAALHRLGFDRIGQLIEAPRAPLARRFGPIALRLLDQALGTVAEPIEPVHPAGLCRTRQSFPEPIATPEDLARITALLAGALCEKLRRLDQGALRLDLIFQRVDGTPQSIRVGTAAPSRDPAHLTRLLTAQIETIDPGFGVETVTLAATLTGRLGARQISSSLTAPAPDLATLPDLVPLIDTLQNRLGEDRLFRAQPMESDIPERSLRPALPMPATRHGAAWPANLPRPTRLLTPPREVQATALLPDCPPAQFIWRRRPHRIRCADGPERVFGEWWREPSETFAVRDYFQVEDQHGQRFWLFRTGDGENPQTGDMRWFLHGLFA